MWRRKKQAETDAQASVAAAAQPSYWATHQEPAQPARSAGAHSTLSIGGRDVDPQSPEGPELRAMLSGQQSYAVSPAADTGERTYLFTGPGGEERLKELAPYIDKHRRHKITDAELAEAEHRILGASSLPHGTPPQSPTAAQPAVLAGEELIIEPNTPYPNDSPEGRQLLAQLADQARGPAAGATIIIDGRSIDPDSPEGREIFAVTSGKQPFAVTPDGPHGQATYTFPGTNADGRVDELLPFIAKHMRHEITDAELADAQRRILGG